MIGQAIYTIPLDVIEKYVSKIIATSPRGQWIKNLFSAQVFIIPVEALVPYSTNISPNLYDIGG